jgi:hypothetical protein
MAITAMTSLHSGEVEQYLDTRALNCCTNAKLSTVGDVAALSRHDMMAVRGCGSNSMIKLDRLLKAAGLDWGWNGPEPVPELIPKECFELAQMLYVRSLSETNWSDWSIKSFDVLAEDCVTAAKRFFAIAGPSHLNGEKEAKDGQATDG